MTKLSRINLLLVTSVAMLIAHPGLANDSEAETSLGGLVLKQNNQISMDSEDLFISAEQVRVKYRYTNTGSTDLKILVSFPLPPQPSLYEGSYDDGRYSDWDGLKFETKVDGNPITFISNERVEVDGKDVSARLMELGLPLKWFENYGWLDKFQETDPAKLQAWKSEGLVAKNHAGWNWFPRWKLVTEISREQLFPAGKTVTVEHSYSPYIGGSAGGALYKDVRENNSEILKLFKTRWCVDDYFLRGIDRRQDRQVSEGKEPYFSETWIGYILSSGANWRGPIKDFRLVVDKGSTANLVSFCMDGVKKIGPTQFEVRKKNFTPKNDLNILILNWYD